jgi:hypothetical protein
MKKRLNRQALRHILLAMLITVGSVATGAKSPVSFGLKLEANTHEFWLYDLDNYDSGLGVAPNIGCFLKADLNDSYSVQSDFLLFFRNTKVKDYGRDDYFRQWGVSLPVYFLKNQRIDRQIWYYGLGVYASAGLNAYMKNGRTALYKKTNGGETAMNRWDYGISTLLGFELHNGIQINACLQLGLKDQLQTRKNDATVINKALTVGVGYRF